MAAAGVVALAEKGHGGRPRAADAALIGDRILAATSTLFLRDGFAATSVEAIAAATGVSKRTFYARFSGKSTAFLAVMQLLVRGWLDGFEESLEPARGLEEMLLASARKMLEVALTPAALSLHALITAEARRVPELAGILRQAGVDAGIVQVAAMVQAHRPGLSTEQARFAAEQFQSMVVAAPQRRAMLSGNPADPAEQDAWCRATVALLLQGLPSPEPLDPN